MSEQFFLDYERPDFYPKQFEAIFEQKRYSLIEASTKSGKTAGCLAWLIEEALKGSYGWNFWWVSPVSIQAMDVFARAQRSIPKEMQFVSLSNKAITLPNGAVIWFKSGDKPNSLYGADVHAVVLDEASRMKEDAYVAVRSTLTHTRGKIRIIGNVRGRKNWFYQMSRVAQSGTHPEMAYHKIIAADAVDAGVLDSQEIEYAKSEMRHEAWRELYLAEPSDDGGNPFGEQHIRHCVKPMAKGAPNYWGWDLAKKQNFTVGIGLTNVGYTCRFERWQHVPWDSTMTRIRTATGYTPALVDSTGVGDPIVEALQKTPGSHFEGFLFNPNSKQKLMEGLAVAIQSHAITFPEGPIVEELMSFEYEITRTGVRYQAAEGCQDDCVMALGLAVMAKNIIPAPLHFSDEVIAQLRRSPKVGLHPARGLR